MEKVVSLFCGCGGFDLGFKQAGFEILRAYDSDSTAVRNYNKNVGDHAVLADLSTEFSRRLVQRHSPDIVLCGSPCQGFSTAGKRNFDDPRNELLVMGAELAISMKPSLIIFENVPAVASGQHGQYWDRVKDVCRDYGYSLLDTVVDMSQYGLAQKRRRRFLFASQFDFSLNLRKADSVRTLREAILGSSRQRNHKYRKIEEGSKDEIIAKAISPGKKLSNVRGGDSSVHTWNIHGAFGSTTEKEKEILQYLMYTRRRNRVRDFGDADPVLIKTVVNEFGKESIKIIQSLVDRKFIVYKGLGCVDLSNTYNGKYRRLSYDSPSLTVDTNFGNPRYFLHPSRNRGFSVREAARIQGFPDDYVFEGAIDAQFRMIGNAVPPMFAAILAKYIREGVSSCRLKTS